MPLLIQGHEDEGHDGIRVEGLTEEELKAYLRRKEPLDSCYTCAGRDTAKPITWREEKDPSAWMKASAGL